MKKLRIQDLTPLAMLVVCLVSVPTTAFAQGVISGLASDPSGAPLPGVSIEAASSALIEHTRLTTSDAAGRYRLEGLPPGTYRVRFALTGWKSFQVDSVTVTGSTTAIADAKLDVGPVSETLTVAVESSAVDPQSAKRGVTLSGELIRGLPTVRSYNALIVLLPGVVTNTADMVTGPAATAFPIHGGRQNEGRLLLDGLMIGSPPSGNSPTTYDVDVGQAQEVSFTVSGGLGEAETAGVVMNIVPKAGGTSTHGSAFGSASGEGFQSSNLTAELVAQGVSAAAPYTRMYDVSATLGGPFVTNRLWYFLSGHSGGNTRTTTNVYYNRNAGNPNEWRYAPDLTRPAYSDRTYENLNGRVTWLATPRNKVSGFWDTQAQCRSCSGATPGLSEPQRVSPEAVGVLGRRLDVTQATWSSPLNDRLLLEAGYGGTFFGVGNFERNPNPTRDLVRVVEQCATSCADNGNIPGLAYRSQDFSVAHTGSYVWKGSLSYVTGTHAFKVGGQQTLMTDDRTWFTNTQALTYRVDNGQPNQLTQSISPWVNNSRATWQAFYLQDQWTWRQLTLQGAVRFDRARSWFPEQQEGPSRFLSTAIVVPRTDGVDSYKDITPRFGLAYDVRGKGTTAFKISGGKYLEAVGLSGVYGNTNPTQRMPQTTTQFGTAGVTRAWTDANRNFAADCDLLNPAAQDLRAAGGDSCGVLSNVNFGRNVLTNSYDARVLNGWSVRPSDWNVNVSLQQKIGGRSSFDATYSHRSFGGFTVADNLALLPSDLTAFSLTAPVDARLPGGGGYAIDGLSDVVPEKAGQVNNLVTSAASYGGWQQQFDGFDVNVSSRVGRNLTVMGGTSTGQTVSDNCDVRAQLPELATTTTGTSAFGAGLAGSAVTPSSPYCRVRYGVLTQVRGLSSYVVPKIALLVSTTFQSKPGAMLAANYAAPNAVVAPSLGRSLSGNAPSVTVNLLRPGSAYGDRINQVDVRLARNLGARRYRAMVGVDVYNVLNSSAVLSYNNAFVPGGPWLQPLTVLTPRLFKVTAEFTW